MWQIQFATILLICTSMLFSHVTLFLLSSDYNLLILMLCLLHFVLFFYYFLSAGLFSEFFSPLSPPDCNDNAFFSFLSSSLQEKKSKI